MIKKSCLVLTVLLISMGIHAQSTLSSGNPSVEIEVQNKKVTIVNGVANIDLELSNTSSQKLTGEVTLIDSYGNIYYSAYVKIDGGESIKLNISGSISTLGGGPNDPAEIWPVNIGGTDIKGNSDQIIFDN